MIDPFRPICFSYPSRPGATALILHHVRYLDNVVCLCTAYQYGTIAMALPGTQDYILFRLEDGVVLSSNWANWVASN